MVLICKAVTKEYFTFAMTVDKARVEVKGHYLIAQADIRGYERATIIM